MKKQYILVFVLCIIFLMTACAQHGENTEEGFSESALTCAVLSETALGEIGAEALKDKMEFEAMLPKDQLTVKALEYMETTLPEVTISEELSADIKVLIHCSGDIGNDGINNIAVIFKNQYYTTGEHFYILAVFEESESGVYRCMEYTDDLFLKSEDDDASPSYFYDVRIEDGKLCVTNAMQDSEYINYESVWMLEDNRLILDEVVESRLSLLTGNGLEIRYKMQEGTAACRATSLWNQSVNERVIYDAVFSEERITMETVDEEYIPDMSEMYCTYAEGGRTYDYWSFNITDEMLAEFPREDAWKIAYINLLDELMKTDEYIDEYRFSLLYVDEDDIPELVYGKSGHWVSMYTYAPGREGLGVRDVVAIMDGWPYGAGGNNGYEYLPGQNVLYNHDQNHAGAEHYSSYFKIGRNKDIVDMYYLIMRIYDVNGELSANEETGRIEYFYNGEREITEEEYSKYHMDGDYKSIRGYYYGHKIITELCKDNAWTVPVWKAAYREVIETVTKEYAESESVLTYDFICLDSDNIPELVIGQPDGDSWVSVYSYTLGCHAEGVDNVAVLVDKWRYHCDGNNGYHYALEAGRIEEYVELGDEGYYYIDYYMGSYGNLSTGWKFLCEREWLGEEEGYKETYYRGNELFTQKRWDYFMGEREALDWELLEGTKTYEEIISILDEM